jgi:LTXXQ motif family protein
MSEAANLLSSECPTYRALTPVGRLQAMEQRLDAMLRAVQTVQPALEKFYASLNDEQKGALQSAQPRAGLTGWNPVRAQYRARSDKPEMAVSPLVPSPSI